MIRVQGHTGPIWKGVGRSESESGVRTKEHYLKERISRIDDDTLAEIPPLEPRSFSRFLSNVSHSEPGEDGVPYAGWRACKKDGADTLYLAAVEGMSGRPFPLGFNTGVTVFMPKGR